MPILPVLDLMHGQIVRGVAGRRDQYRPIVSKLVDSAEPRLVARAFRQQFGFDEFYLADLDAIVKTEPAVDVHADLQSDGFKLWVDAGIRSIDDPTLDSLEKLRIPAIVIGLESIAGPDALRKVVARVGAEQIVFSLDLKAGRPIADSSRWDTEEPRRIAETALAAGVQRMIVLDLAQVGVGHGVGTEDLCSQLKRAYPDVQLTAGGGVRSIEDVRRLESIGVDYVLVASALHDGRITRADLA